MSVEFRVKRIVADMIGFSNAENIKNTDTLIEDLNFDSLDLVETVMMIEEEFEFEITDDDAEELVRKPVGDIIDYVKLHYVV